MGAKLPIVYVRGYAGGQGGIDDAVDDPFYGFNEGAVHVRVGREGTPQFYQYEGPLVRLINEEGYELRVRGSQEQYLLSTERKRPPNSIWIYRFYDAAARTFGSTAEDYDIEEAARGLAAYIELVRSKTEGSPPVFLVAHSMGGLICRTALQRFLGEDPTDKVAKLFTIGTPHGGIDFERAGGIGSWVLERLKPNRAGMFAPANMREYLYEEDERVEDTRVIARFPADRVLSVVGTNARDYENKLAAFGNGVQSDGLVAIRNAYVKGAARTYVHRSHSGRYGLVNSEEVYQTLRRFLFGGLRVRVKLSGLSLPQADERVWQAEVRLAIRGIPVLIHEQTADHYCPVDLERVVKGVDKPTAPVPLVTAFLMTYEDGPRGAQRLEACRYALDIKLGSLVQRNGVFAFADHVEQIGDWQDALVVDVVLDKHGAATGLRWEWNSRLRMSPGERKPLPKTYSFPPAADAPWTANIALPPAARAIVGSRATLSFEIEPWN